MQNPNKANLVPTEEVIALGWDAEARDADGHLMSMTVLKLDDDDLARWIMENRDDGNTVTFFPKPKQ